MREVTSRDFDNAFERDRCAFKAFRDDLRATVADLAGELVRVMPRLVDHMLHRDRVTRQRLRMKNHPNRRRMRNA